LLFFMASIWYFMMEKMSFFKLAFNDLMEAKVKYLFLKEKEESKWDVVELLL
jgi:hypothetical protein